MAKSIEALTAQLDLAIEIHELCQKPYSELYDIKGYLTQRKKDLRRDIAKLARERDA